MPRIHTYRVVLISPRRIRTLHQAAADFGVCLPTGFSPRFEACPTVAVIVDSEQRPVWPPTLFLAHQALAGRSVTGDSVRSYAESLVQWLKFLKGRHVAFEAATEEILSIFRAELIHGNPLNEGRRHSPSTANLRLTVAGLFHQWGERTGSMPSPLGAYLVERGKGRELSDLWRSGRFRKRLGISAAAIHRIPRVLSPEEIARLFVVAPMPYRLMFRWSLATGLRRFEVCNLRIDQLPSAEAAARNANGLLPIELQRKGNRACTVHAPSALVEETNWYTLTERPDSSAQEVFVNRSGRPIARQLMSAMFRRCADAIGSSATLHHLRHTFAVHVLRVLEAHDRRGDAMNSMKTLQVLLGHASIETTEIYLRAIDVAGEPTIDALQFLYGGTLA